MADSSTPPSQSNHTIISNADPANAPLLDIVQEEENGDWAAAKRILENNEILKHAAITKGWSTLLHVAAGANHSHFVEELLDMLLDKHVLLQDSKGNTAFCFAASSGNMSIANLLLDRNEYLPKIRGGGGYLPIQFAVMQGKCEMTWFLYRKINREEFEEPDRKSLFFSSIKTGNHRFALQVAEHWPDLAWARDQNNDTALHILAFNQAPLHSCSHCPDIAHPIKINPGMEKQVTFQLVKYLWENILLNKKISEVIRIISEPYQAIFDAAEVGNFGFLSELISAYPSLIWEVDNENHSIIHTAVSHRHANIFNLIHEIESQKDLIVTYMVNLSNPTHSEPTVIKNNTLLHLAAKLAPPRQLELVSGAALQMCLEIIWFEEVKKIMPPHLIIMKNSDGLTAQDLFTKEHEGLRKKGEEWMKRTAEFCMLISTVIATAVFSAAINIPGGIDDGTKKPNYLNQTSFLVFAISDGAAFISSSTAILIFLSILMSRYAEYDFYKSLPLKLISGLITLFISIACMMVAFASAFFITYNYGSRVIPDYIAVLVCPPLFLYIFLQFSLWSDIIYSTFYWRTLFRPTKRMIYT
ncbi:uncharacterized protein LOC108321055 isoform X2 [Vigna angularis]|uniref:uncharacterized protein LOC108321055 isoform X2 n=1 Tax=Phaseolus angularis TaxID=3914 RepID=UPI0022B383B2|nr:uncharacterized protein LOC108321055 isoform X2 [Vigna angularis]